MLLNIFVSLSALSTALAACTRNLLTEATAQYVDAQRQGTSGFAALSGNVSYTENEQRVNITKGVLAQPLKIDHNRSIHDPVICGTFTELIVTDSAHPYVIGTRMLLAPDSGKVTKIDSIVTDAGDWLFNATGYQYWNARETWPLIPAAKRDSRAAIQAAGDAYFDRFKNENVTVPFGTPCARLEGGAYTDSSGSGNNTCSLGLPSTIVVTNRRYIIDEELGAVDIFVGFPTLDSAFPNQPMPDSHFFRVEGGKIRYIHTV